MRGAGAPSSRVRCAASASKWRGPVSSSSSATERASREDSVAGLLAESFVVLSREIAALYERMVKRLEGISVTIRVDGERFVAAFAGGQAGVRAITSEGEP